MKPKPVKIDPHIVKWVSKKNGPVEMECPTKKIADRSAREAKELGGTDIQVSRKG